MTASVMSPSPVPLSGATQKEQAGSRATWAQVLSKSFPVQWNKNVLEVVLEKDEKGPFIVNHEECAKLLRKLGIDTRPGAQIEEIQICPNGRGLILITLKKDVAIGNFCNYDVIEVTQSGVRAIIAKPVNKREVVINIRNIHPNTKDEMVIDYLNNFGKVTTSKVVYGIYGDGPLKGIRNGDRAYKVELKPSINIGTYHVLDGQKVTLKYSGQLQTCGRCHQNSRQCPGKGIARKCEAENGVRLDFSEYILSLWKEIGYSPENVQIDDEDEHSEEENITVIDQQDGGSFSPSKQNNQEKHGEFSGISIKAFAKEVEQCQVIDILLKSGLPKESLDNVIMKPNGCVTVMSLDNNICRTLIDAMHNKIIFGKKIFCNGIVALTPEKKASCQAPLQINESQENLTRTSTSQSNNSAVNLNSKLVVPQPSHPLKKPDIRISEDDCSTAILPSPGDPKAYTELGNSDDIQQYLQNNSHSLDNPALIRRHSLTLRTTPSSFLAAEIPSHNLDNSELVRRRSLSLRTPPRNSLAAEILSLPDQESSLSNTQRLLKEVEDLKVKLSEYETCESSNDSHDDVSDQQKVQNEVFRSKKDKKYKKRRKSSETPTKETFLKKANMNLSPK